LKKQTKEPLPISSGSLVEAVPYKIHTILTDNGIQFRYLPRYPNGTTARHMTHMFDMRCREFGYLAPLTNVNHPWTNEQVEQDEPHRRPPSNAAAMTITIRFSGTTLMILSAHTTLHVF